MRLKKQEHSGRGTHEKIGPGSYIVLEDDMTVFGGIGHSIGSVAFVYRTEHRVSRNLSNPEDSTVVNGKWLAGNHKGDKFTAIYASRFKRISRPEARKIIKKYAHCQKCLSGKKMDQDCDQLLKRIVGECKGIIPDPEPEF